MLAVGIVALAGALALGAVALVGVPTGRVSAQRIDQLAITPHRGWLTRLTDAVVDAVDSLMRRGGWRPFSAAELELAAIRMPVASLVVMVCSVAVVVLALGVVTGLGALSLLLALLVVVAAKIWLRLRGARTCREFGDQLPTMLQMMAASLRAGHSLPRVIDAVSREVDAPASTQLARVVNENRLGRDLVESLMDVAARMRSVDFAWVASAISAQRQTGGNLNEILDQVATTIRERQHIRLQVRSLSAEGRLSAVILMALPVLIGLYYMLVSAESMSIFVSTMIGKLLVAACAVMYVVGGLWMRSIVDIEF
jgi:tight adherence protein B